MTNVARNVFRIVLAALLCAASGVVAAAWPCYVRVTAKPKPFANGWVPEGYGYLGVIMCAPN